MTTTNKPTVGFWIIAIIALIWNLAGAAAYLGQKLMTDEALLALPENEQSLYANIPIWATAAFAIAVWFGAFGSLLLVLRKKLARPVLMISLLGIIAHFIYNVFLSGAAEVYGAASMIMPAMIVIIGIFLVVYSGQCIKKGWLK
ncbi:MAG: hypothetical protein K0U54_00030 [Bacteroidetes bacterium]|nr:hypothetical protein [Bacteroidota bacterium]